MRQQERGSPGEPELVAVRLLVPAAVWHAVRAAAAREGQPPEAQAVMWLEEHAQEVARTLPG